MAYAVRERPLGSPKHVRIICVGAGASGINLVRTLRQQLAPKTARDTAAPPLSASGNSPAADHDRVNGCVDRDGPKVNGHPPLTPPADSPVLPPPDPADAQPDESSYDLVVYEKNASVGGTWHENRYPGCRCDVPSHNYQFSWRPNPEWSNFFSSAAEIEAYLMRVCDEERMSACVRLRHLVDGAVWLEDDGVWEVTVRDLATGAELVDWAHFLINGGGILNNWKWPDIPGLHDFEGPLVHSAAWPEDFEYRGKVVAVIGNGSSGLQIVPAVAPLVDTLWHFVRTPTWVVPSHLYTMSTMGPAVDVLREVEVDARGAFPPAQIERFKADPAFYRRFVKLTDESVGGNFPVMLPNSEKHTFATAKVKEYMSLVLRQNEQLCRDLIPSFPLGCRRLTPAPGYLEALQRPNVELVTGRRRIARFVRDGVEIIDDDTGAVRTVRLDAVVCATGFDTSFRPRFPLIGRDGVNLQDLWAGGSVRGSYMSCAVAGFPNYFTFLGPNAPIGHGSVFTLVEHVAKYVARAIRKCQTEGIKALCPSHRAADDYAAHVAAFMPRTAWAAGCRSWFKAGARPDAPVTALHPGSRVHFLHMLAVFRGEDYDYVYDHAARANRFWYLGNGFSTMERGGRDCVDPTWYLDRPDEI